MELGRDRIATKYSLFCDKQDVSKPAGFDLTLKMA